MFIISAIQDGTRFKLSFDDGDVFLTKEKDMETYQFADRCNRGNFLVFDVINRSGWAKKYIIEGINKRESQERHTGWSSVLIMGDDLVIYKNYDTGEFYQLKNFIEPIWMGQEIHRRRN